jgi:hypothetical protein
MESVAYGFFFFFRAFFRRFLLSDNFWRRPSP